MAQHFVYSPESRGKLTALEIARLSEKEAYDLLCELRWGNSGTQICPKCGVTRKHYFLKTRNQFRCAEHKCNHTFSVTSKSKFAYHKKPLRDVLYGVALLTNGVEGVSASRNAANMRVGHKPTWIMQHKVREALFQTRNLDPLSGLVQIDGAYFHYYVRPANKSKNRIDRRLARNMNPNKRCVLTMRECGEKGQGALRTIVSVIKYENETEVRSLVAKYVKPGSLIYSDNHSCYTSLGSAYTVKQVNHAEEYSSDDGVNENQAESFFNRLRNLFGQIHKCHPKLLLYYANEIAWREDHRRKSFYWQFETMVKCCLKTGQSRNWSKYWQGNRITKDCLYVAGETP